jgi:alkyl sulfatase BDS1-like metallo-beta-lactamase superfamily hydrolase
MTLCMKHATKRRQTRGLPQAIGLIALITFLNQAHAQQPMPAEPAVEAANRAVVRQLPFGDRQDFEDANRGFIATTPNSSSPDLYKFLDQDAPPTVNPSLWCRSILSSITWERA